jgi:LuxR family maltose regulon positive regulatory protein
LNDLFEIPDPVLLVLDDYHMIESEEIHRMVAFFIDRMPPQVHLCLLSRKQPPIAVGLLRVNGQLNEIGLTDLRFTEQEISSFWLRQTGVLPNALSLQLLSDRTEGWIAGIQLAVLSHMSGQPDALHQFKGDHRFIVDYLMEEVFIHLPEPVRTFLLKTSILERMNVELCAYLTAVPVEMGQLKEMEKSNLFVIPLDAGGHWYRYHHLFADFLRSRYKQEHQGEIISLHIKASEWFEKHGFMGEAIEHALAAEAFDKACSLILAVATELFKRRELTTLHRWLLQLPSSIRERPALLIIQVWTETLIGRKDLMGKHIETLQRALDSPHSVETPLEHGIRQDMRVAKIFQALLLGDFNLSFSLLQELHLDDNLPDIEGLPMLFSLGMELNEGTIPFIRG